MIQRMQGAEMNNSDMNGLANGEPGEVVWANCWNSLENPRATGKFRPAVLLRRDLGHFRLIGLTTNPKFRDGKKRIEIPDPAALGLQRPGFIWSDSVTNISASDIGGHIGWVNQEFVELVLRWVRLSADDVRFLRWFDLAGRAA